MNRDDLEKQILLAESGELDEPARQTLAAQLAADPAAAAWRADAQRLTAQARHALPTGEPSAGLLARLRAAALANSQQKSPLRFPPVWLRGLATAAALALAVGAWLGRGPATDGQPDPIAQMHAIVAITNDEAATPVALPAESDDEDTRLRALAQELLALEGLALDETAYDRFLGEDAPTDDEPTPRAEHAVPSGSLA